MGHLSLLDVERVEHGNRCDPLGEGRLRAGDDVASAAVARRRGDGRCDRRAGRLALSARHDDRCDVDAGGRPGRGRGDPETPAAACASRCATRPGDGDRSRADRRAGLRDRRRRRRRNPHLPGPDERTSARRRPRCRELGQPARHGHLDAHPRRPDATREHRDRRRAVPDSRGRGDCPAAERLGPDCSSSP